MKKPRIVHETNSIKLLILKIILRFENELMLKLRERKESKSIVYMKYFNLFLTKLLPNVYNIFIIQYLYCAKFNDKEEFP